jgi:hypothetical protein
MPNIFRNIRKQLASENKTAAYLRYALGEILLVVIGILIALQVNNWNENRKDHIREVQYLNNLKQDLEQQVVNIDAQLDFEKRIVKISNSLIKTYNANQRFPEESDVFLKISNIAPRKTFRSVNATFSDMESSGALNLITDPVLRKEIINYYQDNIDIKQILDKTLFTTSKYNHLIYKLLKINKNVFDVDTLANVSNPELYKHLYSWINESQNQTALLNSIIFRENLSIAHIAVMSPAKEQTLRLIKEINAQLN